MSKNLFPSRPDSNPSIYAYIDTNPQYKGLLKVGFTNIDVQKRVLTNEQISQLSESYNRSLYDSIN